MAKRPPTPQARLDLFVSLADEYEQMALAFPVQLKTFQIGRMERDPAIRWAYLIRSFALRKFFIGGDNVQVDDVLTALLDFEPRATEVVTALRAATPTLLNGGGRYVVNGGDPLTAGELVKDILYGVFLHGDYDRWQRAQTRRGLLEEMSLFTWVGGAEVQLLQIRDIVRSVLADPRGDQTLEPSIGGD